MSREHVVDLSAHERNEPEGISTALMVHVAPGKPGEPDAAVRLKQWLKLGLRAFGVRAEWAPAREPQRPADAGEIP